MFPQEPPNGNSHESASARGVEAPSREAHIKRVLLAIRNVNQLITHEEDPRRLVERACENLTETLGYYNAWIAVMDGDRNVTITASSGFDGEFDVMAGNLARGRFPGCMREALEEDGVAVRRDPPEACPRCPLSHAYAGRAGLAHRLAHDGKLRGALAVSVPGEYADDTEEQDYLREVAGDLAFALHKIELTEDFRLANEILSRSPAVAFVWQHADRWPVTFVTPNVASLFGRDAEAFLSGEVAYPDVIHPDDLRRVEDEVAAAAADPGVASFEHAPYRIVRPDGELRWVRDMTTIRRGGEGRPESYRGILVDITEQRQRDERIAVLGHMIDAAPAGITVHNTDGRFLFTNRRNCELHGCVEPEDFLALNLADVDVPSSRELIEQRMRQIDRDGEARFEVEHYRADGSTFPLEVLARKTEWDGSPALLSIATDITERKAAEAALRESEQRYRALVMQSADCLIVHDLTGRILDVNECSCRTYGYTREELLGMKVADLDPDYADRAEGGRFYDELKPGKPLEFEARQQAKDGRIFPVEVRISLVEYGGRTLIQGLCRDVSQRQHAMDELRRLESGVEQAVDGIAVADLDGTVRYVNRSWAEMHGMDREEVLGEMVARFHTPRQFGDEVLPALDRIRREGSFEGELGHARADGSTFQTWMSCSLIHGDRGEAVGMVAMARDITDEKAREAQLRQAQKMEAVGRLAAGVAHDFNNQLQVILGYADMLLMDRPEGDPLGEWAGEIRQAARRARSTTSHLLAFSRQQVLHPEIVDVGELLAASEKPVGRMIGEDLELHTEIVGDLPPVRIDAPGLQQALLNLAVNARDAMPDGGRLVIRASAAEIGRSEAARYPEARPGRYVLLEVIDAGTGMDRETLDRMFDPFFTTKAKGKGTGLGMPMVQGFVRQSGGFIRVDSEPGGGTAVRILLPPAGESAPAETAENAPRLAPAEQAATVLIVEDERGVRTYLTHLLERAGYNVLVAALPSEALKLLAGDGPVPDLVISDVVMPEMRGDRLAEELTALRGAMRFLFVTGYSQTRVEGHPTLKKPFSPDELLERVREELRR